MFETKRNHNNKHLNSLKKCNFCHFLKKTEGIFLNLSWEVHLLPPSKQSHISFSAYMKHQSVKSRPNKELTVQ